MPKENFSEMDRLSRVRRVLWWVLLGNLAVAAGKIIYGQMSGFLSIRADGLHSLADSASNVIGLLAISRASGEADAEHPYGHQKLEVAGAIGIGFLIVIGLMEIGRTLFAYGQAEPPLSAGVSGYAVVCVTLAVNMVVTWQESKWGRKLDSPILLADARHTLSDSYATLGVLGAFVATQMGFRQADLLVTFLIMILVGRAAYLIFRQAVDTLLDHSRLDPQTVEDLVKAVSGVRDCHRVRSRGMVNAVFVDFHILVDSQLTIEQAHQITHSVETAVKSRYPEVVDVLIHTEPASDGREPYLWEKHPS